MRDIAGTKGCVVNVMKSFALDGKVVLLTGGAGLYGRQLVAALAEAGATVCIAARHKDKLETVASEEASRGYRVLPYELDQGSEASILALRKCVLAEHGKVDVLVNNAVLRCAMSWDAAPEALDQSFHVNATGLIVVTRVFGDEMARCGSGSIINISSMMGMVGAEPANYAGSAMEGSWNADYHFHKGGMINFTRQAASYYGRSGVRVNCISPGGFQTPDHDPRFVRQYSERTQLGRMAGPEDLKGIIVFLASEASSYITGTNIPVDGGYTAK